MRAKEMKWLKCLRCPIEKKRRKLLPALYSREVAGLQKMVRFHMS
jgi:hypothetical protein